MISRALEGLSKAIKFTRRIRLHGVCVCGLYGNFWCDTYNRRLTHYHLFQSLPSTLFSLSHSLYKLTNAYAHHTHTQRQQVVMMSQLSQRNVHAHPNVRFFSMHPGWSDTAAVNEALPDFHAKMQHVLRTPAQGADTAIWLGLVRSLAPEFDGAFVQDRQPVAKHLPLAWTHSTLDEEQVQRNFNPLDKTWLRVYVCISVLSFQGSLPLSHSNLQNNPLPQRFMDHLDGIVEALEVGPPK